MIQSCERVEKGKDGCWKRVGIREWCERGGREWGLILGKWCERVKERGVGERQERRMGVGMGERAVGLESGVIDRGKRV